MIKHVILWQLKDGLTEEQIIEVKAGIKSGLEGLKGEIPGLIDIKVVTEGLASSNADVMLDSTFESEEALKNYATHKFSIPSMAIHSDSFEVSHIEFQIDESVKPEEGLLTRLVKLARKFMPEEKADDKQENPEKTEETK